MNAPAAVIKTDDGYFREFVLFMQDGLDLYDREGKPIPDPMDTHGGSEDHEEEEGVDYEDQGQKGFNYRSENFSNRFKTDKNPLHSLSTKIHGDPSTPILKAYAGENIRIRLLMPADKPRNNCFVLHGHTWKAQPMDPYSPEIWSQGAISIASVYNISFTANPTAGDYAYRSGAFRWSVEQGMWGILRVKGNQHAAVKILKIIVFLLIILFVALLLYRLLINSCNKKRKE